MDLFVKELRLNSSSGDVIKHCLKLVEWMPLSPKDSLECTDIETLIKGCIFLYECSRIFDFNIVDSLAAHEPFFTKYYTLITNIYSDRNLITSLHCSILKTPNTLRNTVLLDNVFKSVEKLYPNRMEHATDLLKGKEIKYRKLDLLVNRIFQLPFTQIDTALNKICYQIEFDILGLLFCLKTSGETSAKYAILEYKLCQKLKSTDPNDYKYFLRSITTCIVKSVDGIHLFRKCIENKYFWEALCNFFYNFIKSLQDNGEAFEISQYSDLLYLIKITLEIKCSNLHENTINMPSNIRFPNILTQLCALFN